MKFIKHTKWKGKSRGGFFGHFYFMLIIRYLGIKVAYFHLILVVPYFVPFAPKATKSIWIYNRQILKYGRIKSFIMIFVHYFRFGQTIIDRIACINGLDKYYKFEFDNYDEFLKILDAGSGVIVVGAHVGSWEIGSLFFHQYGKKINVVLYDAEYQKIKHVIEKKSDEKNYKVILLNEGALSSVIKIKNTLAENEFVCFQGDRYLDGATTFTTQFMGNEAKFPKGPFVVASRMHVPIVFYFAMRENNQAYRFYFSMPPLSEKEQGVSPEDLLFTHYKTALENMVKSYPQQWFNFYPFWKTH